jgi:two-component system chemotaxis response regulator CheB
MSRDQRLRDNWALLLAQHLARSRGAPLIVLFALARGYLGPPLRAFRFLLDGLRGVAADAAAAGVPFGLLACPSADVGAAVAAAVRRAGAAVIAQDEQSSTIWGMPGSIVRAQHASAIIALDDIGAAIRGLVRMGQLS